MKIDWHPYPEEKPKNGQCCLVTYVNERGERKSDLDIYALDDICVYWLAHQDVIAWAELPEPYDPSGENE